MDGAQWEILFGTKLDGVEIPVHRGGVRPGDHVLDGVVAWTEGPDARFRVPFPARVGEITRVVIEMARPAVVCRVEGA